MTLLEFAQFRPLMGPLARYPVSAQVGAGELLVVSGPSGCGKTTLLRALARLSGYDGHLKLCAKPAADYSGPSWRRQVALVSQRPVAFPGTVRSNLLAGFALAIRKDQPSPDDAQLGAAMRACGLSADRLEQNAAELSGGELARVALLRALLTHPVVLLLDEPTAALDGDTRDQVLQYVDQWRTEAERAVILVTHRADDLKHLHPPITRLELAP